jgi:hypothetical protein
MTNKERELISQIEKHLPELKAQIDVARKDLGNARSLATAIAIAPAEQNLHYYLCPNR